MGWRAKVELYDQIRREYEFGLSRIIGVVQKLVVHLRTVREAVRNWDRLLERLGRQPGTRAMVELIHMGRESGYEKLTVAVEQALA